MKIEGREFNKRLCLSSIYISYIDQRENFPGYQFNGEELEIIQKISDILKRLSIEENVYENLEPMACAELVEEVERAFTIVGMIKVYGYNRNIVPYILRR